MRPETRAGNENMHSDEIPFLESGASLDEVFQLPRAVLYKHSTRCGSSLRAMLEVERFARTGPGVPVFAIDVTRHRDVSDRAAKHLGVAHQSPQAILIQAGGPVWSASHSLITVSALVAALQESPPG